LRKVIKWVLYNFDKTENLKSKYGAYNTKPKTGINGDFKDDNRQPEGYNMKLITPTIIKEKSGKYKSDRVSLRLKDSWIIDKSPSLLTENKLALGGGFRVIKEGWSTPKFLDINSRLKLCF
jgi:hypothetical protein